jgi:hypothetical protein
LAGRNKRAFYTLKGDSASSNMKETERERIAPVVVQARAKQRFAGSRSVYDLVNPRIFLDLRTSLSVFYWRGQWGSSRF